MCIYNGLKERMVYKDGVLFLSGSLSQTHSDKIPYKNPHLSTRYRGTGKVIPASIS